MSRSERAAGWLWRHPVLSVFLLLTALPATVAVFSFRPPIPLPDAVLPGIEVLFWLLVYAPVTVIRAILFDPLGLDVLFSIPGVQQALVFLTLLGFYFALSVVLVRGSQRFGRSFRVGR